jgi:pimeloyl-ACP methyl ester carboxylesterase
MEWPIAASFFRRLSSFCRLILFDKRGTGLSDRTSPIATIEDRMDDVRAVMDSAGSERAALLGFSEGGPMSIVFAATYPQRTSTLLLCGAFARYTWAPDNVLGNTDEQQAAWLKTIEQEWGQGNLIVLSCPSVADDQETPPYCSRTLSRRRTGLSNSVTADGTMFLLNIIPWFVNSSRDIAAAKSTLPATVSWRRLMVRRVRFVADGQLWIRSGNLAFTFGWAFTLESAR